MKCQIVPMVYRIALYLLYFPAIIFLFTLIPYVSMLFPEVTKESIMQFLGQEMPRQYVRRHILNRARYCE